MQEGGGEEKDNNNINRCNNNNKNEVGKKSIKMIPFGFPWVSSKRCSRFGPVVSQLYPTSIYKFGLSVCLFVCLSVCLFVSNKRQNG